MYNSDLVLRVLILCTLFESLDIMHSLEFVVCVFYLFGVVVMVSLFHLVSARSILSTHTLDPDSRFSFQHSWLSLRFFVSGTAFIQFINGSFFLSFSCYLLFSNRIKWNNVHSKLKGKQPENENWPKIAVYS